MYDATTNISNAVSDPGGELFAWHAPKQRRTVFDWVAVLLAISASLIVAIGLCPVPPPQVLLPRYAFGLALAYVVATVLAGAPVLTLWALFIVRKRAGISAWPVVAVFCAAAAWLAPTVAFYLRDSFWAVAAATVFAILASRLIWLLVNGGSNFYSGAERQYVTRRTWLTVAALLLQLGAVSTLASRTHAATLLVPGAILTMSLFRPAPAAMRNSGRACIAVVLAVIFVGASLTPYLAVPVLDLQGGATNDGPQARRSAASSRRISTPEFVAAFFLYLLSRNGSGNQHPSLPAAAKRPFPVLQSFFGEHDTAKQSNVAWKKPRKGETVALVAGESFPGIILRPRHKKDVIVQPPAPTQRVFDRRPNEKSVDPVNIPFDGTYWFFRRDDAKLPADTIEMRGDADSTTMKTTDYSPMMMEAHQYLGSQIDLSCCRAIEVTIANADRRPHTVAMELVLRDTAAPGKPQQSLGVEAVNSSLRWYPGDDGHPVTDVLKFPVPATVHVRRFDEITVRFHLQFPRQQWSAKIAIIKFRLVP